MEFLIYLAKSAAILTIFYLVYYFFLRKDTLFTAKRFFFIAGIIAALCLPFLEYTSNIEMQAPIHNVVEISPVTMPFNEITSAAVVHSSNTIINWFEIGMYIYLGIVIFFLSRFVLRLVSLKKLLTKHTLKKKGTYFYVTIDDDISPFSIFNFIVFNPKLHNEHELEMILKHEQVHARQWHSVDIILSQILTILQWANPFSWAYKKEIEANLEYIADSQTVEQLNSKKAYQYALVNASSPITVPALTSPFYQSLIKKRIIMLNKNTSHRRNLIKVSLVLPALALFLYSFNVKEEITYVTPTTTNNNTVAEDITLPTSIEGKFEPKSTPLIKTKDKIEHKELDNVADLENKKAVKKVMPLSFQTTKTDSKKTPLAEIKNPIAISKVRNDNSIESKIDLEQDKFYKYKITKNTTDAELDNIKAELKEKYSTIFTYSLTRNSNGEITQLVMTHSDANGNSGNYTINDMKPIADVLFYKTERGHGFSQGEISPRMRERLLERRENFEHKREELNEKREQLREQHNEERILKRNEWRSKRQNDRQNERHIVRKEQRINGDNNGHKSSYKLSSNSSHNLDVYITKNTTDGDLAQIKTELAAKDIIIHFKKIQRNSNGDITRIKIDVKDLEGNEQSIYKKSTSNKAIDAIHISL